MINKDLSYFNHIHPKHKEQLIYIKKYNILKVLATKHTPKDGKEELPMYSIRQESLCFLEQLLEMSPEEKYSWLFETIDITPILRMLGNLGASESLVVIRDNIE